MDDSRFFAKGKASELEEELRALDRTNKQYKKKDVLKKIVANMTMGNDMSPLFNHVIQCAALPGQDVKKMIYLYLIHYSKYLPELSTLTISLLLKDTRDPNALTRAVSIRTMGYLSSFEMANVYGEVLRRGFSDRDSIVRRICAIGVAKFYLLSPRQCIDEALLPALHTALKDSNPAVVACAVMALLEISDNSQELKFKPSSEQVDLFVEILGDCSEWYQICLLEAINRYEPQSTEQARKILGRLSAFLKHANAAVCTSAAKVLVNKLWSYGDASAEKSIIENVSIALVSIMGRGQEMQYMVLRNALLLTEKYPTMFSNASDSFFCLFTDKTYVKLAKLELLVRLANEENCKKIIHELLDYSGEVEIEFSRAAVRSIGRCALKVSSAALLSFEHLLQFLKSNVSYVLHESIIMIKNILRRYPGNFDHHVPEIVNVLDLITEPEALAAITWIIGQYATVLPNSSELLEEVAANFLLDTPLVQLAIVSAVARAAIAGASGARELFRNGIAAKSQHALINPDVRRRILYYNRLVCDVPPQIAQTIMLSARPSIQPSSRSDAELFLRTCPFEVGTLPSVLFYVPVYNESPQALSQTAANIHAPVSTSGAAQNLPKGLDGGIFSYFSEPSEAKNVKNNVTQIVNPFFEVSSYATGVQTQTSANATQNLAPRQNKPMDLLSDDYLSPLPPGPLKPGNLFSQVYMAPAITSTPVSPNIALQTNNPFLEPYATTPSAQENAARTNIVTGMEHLNIDTKNISPMSGSSSSNTTGVSTSSSQAYMAMRNQENFSPFSPIGSTSLQQAQLFQPPTSSQGVKFEQLASSAELDVSGAVLAGGLSNLLLKLRLTNKNSMGNSAQHSFAFKINKNAIGLQGPAQFPLYELQSGATSVVDLKLECGPPATDDGITRNYNVPLVVQAAVRSSASTLYFEIDIPVIHVYHEDFQILSQRGCLEMGKSLPAANKFNLSLEKTPEEIAEKLQKLKLKFVTELEGSQYENRRLHVYCGQLITMHYVVILVSYTPNTFGASVSATDLIIFSPAAYILYPTYLYLSSAE